MSYVIVYGALHYGERCRVLERSTKTILVQHEESGDVFAVLACDTEAAP